jgi:hypothetical protein
MFSCSEYTYFHKKATGKTGLGPHHPPDLKRPIQNVFFVVK